MVVVLPGCRQYVDRGDRDFGFESACDEGAYHPGPTLAIPPPPLGCADLELSQSGVHGRLGLTGFESRQSLGFYRRDAPAFELSGEPTWPPATALGPDLHKAPSDPQIIHQTGRFAPGNSVLDFVCRVLFPAKLVLELAAKVIAARQEGQGRLICGFLRHESPELHSALGVAAKLEG